MGIVPVDVWHHLSNDDNNAIVVRSPAEPNDKGNIQISSTKNLDPLEKIALAHRVLIVEGISGSGKDTFQSYLKSKLNRRDVRDYSEGEVLLSWNQLQIKGVFNLQLQFMKLFVNYASEIITQDSNAVFLLNRFHLSAYAMTIIKQPQLEKEYSEIIDVLRRLPVHVFILLLAENEIEKRSLHPERSYAWQKFQEQIVKKDGFRDKVERYIWQQRLMLEAAEKQQIPYSVIKLPSTREIENKQDSDPKARIGCRIGQMNAADAKSPRRRPEIPEPYRK